MSPIPALTALLFTSLLHASAEKRVYEFNITRSLANPDGKFERSVIGINGQWPIPPIVANVNDTIVVNVHNQLGDEDTSLHFHGMYQNGTAWMDGVAAGTQCPIGPDSRFIYEFNVTQPGTYWYHSHNKGQYPDGLRGPLIIHDPDSPYKGKYDEEIVLTLSDWYHKSVPSLLGHFISRFNPTGAEPVPQAALMNDTQNLDVRIQPGKTYMVRVINVGAFAAQYLWFEGHSMSIIETDGVYHDPADAELLYLTAGQRYSFLITTKNTTDQNYAFVGSMDTELFDKIPADLNPNVTGWLVYDEAKTRPDPVLLDEFSPFDDFTLVPEDKQEIFKDPAQSIQLDLSMDNLGDGANYAFFNNITYVGPVVPSFYTTLSAGQLATDPRIYGPHTNAFVLGHQEVIEIVINNMDKGKHPMHMHGHDFQVVYRSDEAAGMYDPTNTTVTDAFAQVPMRRDTVLVRPEGFLVLRFRADNPGIWMFHCHIEWHVSSGLSMTLVEAPEQMQKIYNKPDGSMNLPPSHEQACKEQGISTAGNPVGNLKDFYNFDGIPSPPDPLPDGFTAKGIVALVFSCVSAFLGMVVIGWYGSSEIRGRSL